MGTIIIDNVDDELKNRFKAECYKRGLSMREVLLRLMELELDKQFSVVLEQRKEVTRSTK